MISIQVPEPSIFGHYHYGHIRVIPDMQSAHYNV